MALLAVWFVIAREVWESFAVSQVRDIRNHSWREIDETVGSGAEVRTTLFKSELVLPRARGEVFEFFSNAENLEALTPPWVRFRILTECPITMRTGCLIDYKLRVRGIPIRWRTEITAWEPPFRFVDQMIRGPYRQWIHEHIFEEHPDGTLVIDRVNYAVWGGQIIDRLFVRRDIDTIFAFRRQKLLEMFS